MNYFKLLDNLFFFKSPAAANKLYKAGIRSLDELRANQDLLNHAQQVGLKYFNDLMQPIPRKEMLQMKVKFDLLCLFKLIFTNFIVPMASKRNSSLIRLKISTNGSMLPCAEVLEEVQFFLKFFFK